MRKMMNFVLKTRDFESKTRNSVLKMMNYADGADWPPPLRWIHNTFTGIDGIVAAQPPAEVIVTNMRGRFDVIIAEFVLTWMLMACKQMAALMKHHQEAIWPNLPRDWTSGGTTLLRGKTVAIIGLGSIGSAMAEMYSLMGMRVLGLRRTASPGQQPPQFVDALYPLTDLHTVLALADFVVLAMPETPESAGMIGKPELCVMQPHAALMNIARGGIVVWDEALEALRDGEIGAYYSDVADGERRALPADHPDWSTPGLFVTPHQSFASDDYGDDDVTPSGRFVSNLHKLLTGSAQVRFILKNLHFLLKNVIFIEKC